MCFRSDSEDRIDTFKLEGDLRDAYVELLSAQFAVDRIKTRYSPDDIATRGSAFMVARSISAATSIGEYFSHVHKCFAARPLARRPEGGERGDEDSAK